MRSKKQYTIIMLYKVWMLLEKYARARKSCE